MTRCFDKDRLNIMGIKTGVKDIKGELTAAMADNLERAKNDLEITY